MNKEYLPIIAEYIYRYSPARPKLAMDRLMKVEVIRNNLSKTTVYNMLIGVKRYLREGKINRGMSKELINEIQKLKETRGIPQEITKEQPKELTIDEQIQHLNNQFEVAEQQLDAVIDCIDNKIEELQQQKKETEHLKQALGIEYNQLYNQLFSAKAKLMLI